MSKNLKDGLPLEASGLEWLRYHKGCFIVMMERGTAHGRPDLMGVTKDGYCIEIEVKRTVADFKADQEKRHRVDEWTNDGKVRQLYYLVHPSILEKVTPLLPAGCGLMTVNPSRRSLARMPELIIKVRAAVRKHSRQLTDAEKWELCRDMSGTLVTAICCHPSRRRWHTNKKP